MLFSKSFGYALRGILYIAASQQEGRPVQVEDIARELEVPKFFLAKILKGLVKEGFLASLKGPRGGFRVPASSLNRPLIDLLAATDGLENFHACVLQQKACNPANPCPLHPHVREMQNCLRDMLTKTLMSSFLNDGPEVLLRSLGTDRTGIALLTSN
ncbi:Rrf2 family transcriptional regulator [Flaviaesturariibacter flavus]|uniref:Rrf2 family transcriptional regulator n=1 Tax=Flaviaesturariibacter flavus TaxID=2502780 RepID=A0A4R1BPQ9_9BACT|nr:Rrf2 family transcriptional regulator [Flaviaesturariibacter flavus]TCJ19629.1 Rrf2 family transcriptional regulator [Flaviaesturariibacter flavus]